MKVKQETCSKCGEEKTCAALGLEVVECFLQYPVYVCQDCINKAFEEPQEEDENAR